MFTYFGSDGFKVFSFGSDHKLIETFSLPQDSITSVSLASKGKTIGLLDKEKVTVLNVESRSTFDICMKDQSQIAISPCGRILFTYASYKSLPGQIHGHPNVNVFSVADGKLLKTYIHRQNEGWRPQWTSDSTLCAVRVDGEIHIYTDNRFDDKPADRLAVKGARHFVLSSAPNLPHIALFIPGDKGYPSVVRVFQWRDKKCRVVTNKSFFRADSVSSIWNDRGTDLLVLTSTKSSNESYYGDQFLYYITTNESLDNAAVPMPRKGSIYEVVWKPGAKSRKEQVFVVCYGDPPASVTVFGLDCGPLFTFPVAYCNRLIFNPHGNLLLFAGLGNLPGDISVWDFDRRELLSSFKTVDISTISWFNDGEHLLMATVTPRLRVNNGFGVWHYGGQKLFFQRTAPRAVPKPATAALPASTDHELYDVKVLPQAILPPAPTPKKFAASAGSSLNASAKYVPPALRNRSDIAKQSSAVMQMATGLSEHNPASTTASKPKRRKKPKASGGPAEHNVSDSTHTNALPSAGDDLVAPTSRSIEVKKQITRIRQKLNQIEKLKAEHAAGKQLDFNQVEKVATEKQLREELAKLSITD